MTYRIQRSARHDKVVFTLSGDMDSEHTAKLQEFLASEANARVILDLKDITLVDRAGLQFLAAAEGAGVVIVNFPDYVRSWIAAERHFGQQSAPDPEQPNPVSSATNPYVPTNMPAIGDLFDMFDFGS